MREIYQLDRPMWKSIRVFALLGVLAAGCAPGVRTVIPPAAPTSSASETHRVGRESESPRPPSRSIFVSAKFGPSTYGPTGRLGLGRRWGGHTFVVRAAASNLLEQGPEAVLADTGLSYDPESLDEIGALYGLTLDVNEDVQVVGMLGAALVVYTDEEIYNTREFLRFDFPEFGLGVPVETGVVLRFTRWFGVEFAGSATFSRFRPRIGGEVGIQLSLGLE